MLMQLEVEVHRQLRSRWGDYLLTSTLQFSDSLCFDHHLYYLYYSFSPEANSALTESGVD